MRLEVRAKGSGGSRDRFPWRNRSGPSGGSGGGQSLVGTSEPDVMISRVRVTDTSDSDLSWGADPRRTEDAVELELVAAPSEVDLYLNRLLPLTPDDDEDDDGDDDTRPTTNSSDREPISPEPTIDPTTGAPIPARKVKESYRKKGKKEQQAADFDKLRSEIRKKMEEAKSASDKYPDMKSRFSAAYREVLRERSFEVIPELDYEGAKMRRRIGGSGEGANIFFEKVIAGYP